MDFNHLVANIQRTQKAFQEKTAQAINQNLIFRNWLVGLYIVEFEQKGQDYALYGERLLTRLADELKRLGMQGVGYTNLTLFRKFYLSYPQMEKLVKDILPLPASLSNLQTVSENFSGQRTAPEILFSRLSFSHFIELLKVEEAHKRIFYELECLNGNWSVRQLRRQIGSLLYERTGLSKNKTILMEQLAQSPQPQNPADLIRDPYVFEFLGLKPKEVFSETDLEKAFLDHLQAFLLEMGTGFCLEARQKSFAVDNRRYKVDLLFYHRILKCHVIIDLKLGAFEHEDAGQMNFYLNYFNDNERKPDDNPPVGIILCSYKNEAVVKYATGGLDNALFVSRYLLQLPSEQMLQEFILSEQKNRKIEHE